MVQDGNGVFFYTPCALRKVCVADQPSQSAQAQATPESLALNECTQPAHDGPSLPDPLGPAPGCGLGFIHLNRFAFAAK